MLNTGLLKRPKLKLLDALEFRTQTSPFWEAAGQRQPSASFRLDPLAMVRHEVSMRCPVSASLLTFKTRAVLLMSLICKTFRNVIGHFRHSNPESHSLPPLPSWRVAPAPNWGAAFHSGTCALSEGLLLLG